MCYSLCDHSRLLIHFTISIKHQRNNIPNGNFYICSSDWLIKRGKWIRIAKYWYQSDQRIFVSCLESKELVNSNSRFPRELAQFTEYLVCISLIAPKMLDAGEWHVECLRGTIFRSAIYLNIESTIHICRHPETTWLALLLQWSSKRDSEKVFQVKVRKGNDWF